MRILIVGASGTLGRAVSAALAYGSTTEILRASRDGDFRVDLTDPGSIKDLYDTVGRVDAVVCAAGYTPFKPLSELSRDDFQTALTNKLLGQIELVRAGIDHVADGGSFTLVSGVLAYDPITSGAAASTVNGAVDAFVRAAAIELPRGQRINTISATVLAESWDSYGSSFLGFTPVSSAVVANAYVKSVHGSQTGQVYRVGC